MKNTYSTWLFSFVGMLLWLPILVGYVAMTYSAHPLARAALYAVGFCILSYVTTRVIRAIV